jgi:hypothetical protein
MLVVEANPLARGGICCTPDHRLSTEKAVSVDDRCYATLTMHLESLLERISPGLDAPITAQLLLNALNVNLMSYLRRERGVSPEAIEAATRPLIGGLTG